MILNKKSWNAQKCCSYLESTVLQKILIWKVLQEINQTTWQSFHTTKKTSLDLSNKRNWILKKILAQKAVSKMWKKLLPCLIKWNGCSLKTQYWKTKFSQKFFPIVWIIKLSAFWYLYNLFLVDDCINLGPFLPLKETLSA